MRRKIIIAATFVALMSLQSCHSRDKQESPSSPFTEADIGSVDATLIEEYQKHRVLFIAHDNHTSKVPQKVLQRLLHLVGNDENLAGVIIERHHDSIDVWNQATNEGIDRLVQETKEWIKSHPTPIDSEMSREIRKKKLSIYSNLCMTPEWTYTLTDVAKDIQNLNKKRNEPLRIIPIDGISRYKKIYWPQRTISDTDFVKTDSGCESFVGGSYITSIMREHDTAATFADVYKNLPPEKKLIVIYHSGHLILDTEECFAQFDDGPRNFRRIRSKDTWRHLFFSQYPEAKSQSGTIFVDSNAYSRDGQLISTATYSFNASITNENGKDEFSLGRNALDRLTGNYLSYVIPGSGFHDSIKTFNPRSESRVADQYDAMVYIRGESSDDFYKHPPTDYDAEICQPIMKSDVDPWGCINELCSGDGTP
jgi:hypothetical protein